jgi:group II intron reverse transcriptase/maturase
VKINNSKEKVRQLQNKLYLTAKKCDTRRFHALYDKVHRDDVLFESWKRVKANQGSSGIDGISLEMIEASGIEAYLVEIQKELKEGTYQPSPVRRVMIPKADGTQRPLGIPTVKDRIVQMATKIAIEPVFEADFKECSYGFRPKRSAKQALEVVRKACNNKGYYVVDADIQKFFDQVNQEKLMKLIEQRISDRRIQKLIRQWLRAGILYGEKLKISDLGTSQGSVISPLLANIYLNTLDRLWEKYGLTHGKLVRYADDSVIVCKNKKSANHALNLLTYIMTKLDLTLHPIKTKIVCLWDGKEGFDFLGMHNRRFNKLRKDKRPYGELYQYPSKRAMKKMKNTIKETINKRYVLSKSIKELVKTINRKIIGCRNYYKTRNDIKWMTAIDWYILCTFTRWYNKKHKNCRYLSKLNKVKGILREQGLQYMFA